MKKNVISLGTGPEGPITLDLEEVINAHMLIQAGTSAGKSWLLRRIAEQAFPHVQIIVIDPEGEFASLREKHGFVLAGPGGEAPVDVRSAALLTRRLLEIKASAVIDLFELSIEKRQEWVRLALQALDTAPKNLWHPVLVMIDEAAMFSPEKGEGDSVATLEVSNLVTRGAKRGHGLIAAMHRLSTFRKSVAGLIRTVMVGATTMDLDQERAARMMGVRRTDQPEFFHQLKHMKSGNFYGLGPAFGTRDRISVEVGPVKTTHPERGFKRSFGVRPPTPSQIKHLLPQLADLPKEAEDKARTEAEMKAEIGRLNRELVAAKRAVPQAPVAAPAKIVEKSVLKEADLKRIERLVDKLGVAEEGFKEDLASKVDRLAQAQQAVVSELGSLRFSVRESFSSAPTKALEAALKSSDRYANVPKERANHFRSSGEEETTKLPKGARAMLAAIASSHVDSLTRRQVATLAGIKFTGGTYAKYLSILNTGAYIEVRGDQLSLTDKGRDAAGEVEKPMGGQALLEHWQNKLPKGCRSMLDHIVKQERVTRDAWADSVGIEGGGGTFAKYLSILVTRGLVEKIGSGTYAPSPMFEGV